MSRIVYVNQQFIICNKAPGEPAQPGKSPDPSTLSLAESELSEKLHVVHRIDQRASGLILFARSAESAAGLSALLARHEIARSYLAIVSGQVEPSEGSLEHTLLHDRRSNRSRVSPRGKIALLHYQTVATGDRYTLVAVTLSTGRHHQIRTQLAAAGWPIRGDVKYGARRTVDGGGICLHAFRLEVPFPPGSSVTVTAPPPEMDIWHSICPAGYLGPARATRTGG